jgi:choline dehydrogenase-like flavoprotein
MTNSGPLDAIIVGSGAGGSAAAYRLARAGLRIALVEKGGTLPSDGSTLDFQRVVHDGVFKSREPWLDNRGVRFHPEEYFNVGGKTKWYGAALLRYGAQEFSAEPDYQCTGWPITDAELAPYYAEAEALLGVRRFDVEKDLERIVQALVHRAPVWQHEALPLGLSPQILQNSAEARHFDGFASVAGLKADAQIAFLDKIAGLDNSSVMTGCAVIELLGAADDPTCIEGVRLSDGRELRARAVLLAAGALHSPRLLQSYFETQGLNARLPCAANVGRFLKYHLLTAVIGLSIPEKTDLIRKTRLILNADLPHSSIQPLGFDAELISTLIPRFVPRGIARLLGRHAYGFFLQTEDGAHRENRVIAASKATGDLPVIDYDAARTPVAAAEHRRLVRGFKVDLARTGLIAFSQRVGLAGTAHVSGTLTAGHDPNHSVVDSQGQVHGMNGLFVVDGSILPRSSRVNPSLTIYAWALRTAEHLANQLKTYAAP